MLWLKEYIGTIIIGLVLLSVVTAIIMRLIRRKKAGKCIACDACSHCNSSTCKSKANKNEADDTYVSTHLENTNNNKVPEA